MSEERTEGDRRETRSNSRDSRSRSPYEDDRFIRQRKEDEYWKERRERRERYATRGTDNVWGRSPSRSDLQRIQEEHEEADRKAAKEFREAYKHLKEPKKESPSDSESTVSSSSSSSEKHHRKKKHRKKKSKKERSSKKGLNPVLKKKRKRSRHSFDDEVPAKVKKEHEEDEWVEFTKERRDEETQRAREEEAQIIGPQIPEHIMARPSDAITNAYFDGTLDAKDRKNMLRGEAVGMAAYIAQGKRIPRRGEIGLSSDQISEFEKVGYIMSGTRHKSMEATRLRKENQILTAEEKRLLGGFTREQRKNKEETIMKQFQSLISSKRGT